MPLTPAPREREPRIGEIGRFVVPLGDRRILAWFLEHLHVEHGHGGRIRHAILRGTGRWAPGVERMLFERTGPVRRGDPAIGAARRAVEAFGDALPGPAPARWILVRDDPREARGRAVIFPFAEDAAEPSGVLRLRSPGGGPSLRREAEALSDARRRLPPDLADTLPTVLARGDTGDLEVQAETLLPGRSAYVELRGSFFPSWRAERHFGAAADWLAALQNATRGPAGTVAVHGDFWPRNLLIDRSTDSIGVVDWEWYRRSGSPFRDLFDFPVGYALAWPWIDERRRDPLEALTRAFVGPGRVFRTVRAYLRRWADAVEIDPTELREAFPDYVEGRAPARREEVPWTELRRRIESAGHSVFSG